MLALPDLALRPGRLAGATLACALALAAPARAELSDESLMGLGIRSQPAYDGSASQVYQVVPVVRYFDHPWFVRSTQDFIEAGARTTLAPNLHAGAQLAFEPGRRAEDSSFLRAHDVPDLPRGVSLGAHLEWDHWFGPLPTTWLLRLRQRVGDDEGTQADARVTAGVFRYGPLAGGVWAAATWSNRLATQQIYGIGARESLLTGLPAYAPGAGWLTTDVGAGLRWDLSHRWMVAACLETHDLAGPALHSPLVQRSSNLYATLGAAYRF